MNQLPELCLLALFRQLPLTDLFTIAKVNQHWSNLVPKTTRSITSLAILASFDLQNYKLLHQAWYLQERPAVKLLVETTTLPRPIKQLTAWNTLYFDALSDHLVDQITTTFPSVQSLQVAMYNNSGRFQLNYLTKLLRPWSARLVSFKLMEGILGAKMTSSSAVDHFYHCLHLMPALKNLSLHLHSLPHRDLSSILRQLEQFDFHSATAYPIQFIQMLERVGPVVKPSLRLSYTASEGGKSAYANLELFTALSVHIRNAFIQLHLHWSVVRNPEPLCSSFPSLQTLQLFFPRMTLRHIFHCLSQLPALVHLFCCLNLNSLPADNSEWPFAQIRPLKVLELRLSGGRSHEDLDQLKLSWTMPSLEVLDLAGAICGECDQRSAVSGSLKSCQKAMLRRLKKSCSGLRTILLEDVGVVDAVMLAEE